MSHPKTLFRELAPENLAINAAEFEVKKDGIDWESVQAHFDEFHRSKLTAEEFDLTAYDMFFARQQGLLTPLKLKNEVDDLVLVDSDPMDERPPQSPPPKIRYYNAGAIT